jgi:nucleoid-associated protein Lsr2
MSTRAKIELVDDFDEGEVAETVPFDLDGTSYEIDLSAANAQALRGAFNRYVRAGRKVGKVQRAGHRANYSRSSVDANPATVRAWAASNGIEVSPNDRIKKDVVARFLEAQI